MEKATLLKMKDQIETNSFQAENPPRMSCEQNRHRGQPLAFLPSTFRFLNLFSMIKFCAVAGPTRVCNP